MSVIKNQRTDKQWTEYLATAYAEGFNEGENSTAEERAEAWCYLATSGLAYQLQGWFGRTVDQLIEQGYIDNKGNINWDLIDEE